MKRAGRAYVAAASLGLSTALSALPSCAPPFTPPNLVDRPRFVAVMADPAVTLPGTSVDLAAMLAGAPDGAENALRFRVCVEASNPPDALNTPTTPAQDCLEGRSLALAPDAVGPTATVRIPSGEAAITRLVRASIPDEVPIELGFFNALRSGLRLVVTVRATVNGVDVRAHKRIIVALTPAAYPPAYMPAFSLGPLRFEPDASDPFRCTLVGDVRALAPATRTQLTADRGPIGGLGEQTYQHYATAGTFENVEVDARLSPWTAPATRGATTHWLVAQSARGDGNGPFTPSFAACRFTVPVE